MKLNLGCGINAMEGYVNLDRTNLPGVDTIHNLNIFPYPFRDNQFEEVMAMGVIELLDNFIKVMEELHRITIPGARIIIRSPLFPNQCSAQDPLTKKFITFNSFDYFKPNVKNLAHYSTARFNVEKEIIFSRNKYLKFLNPLFNIFPKFYIRFLFSFFPANEIKFTLITLKL